MNLLLVEQEELDGQGCVVLVDRRARHILEVLHAQAGDRIRVGMVRGATGEGIVQAIDPPAVTLRVTCRQTTEIPTIDLVLAVPRPKALSRALQAAASYHLRRIDLINTWRVDRSYLTSHKLSMETLIRDLHLGCEQGSSTWIPDIALHRFFVPFLQEELAPRLAREPERKLLVAHPYVEATLETVLSPGCRQPLVLVLGPDGGFIAGEIDSFRNLGGQVVSVGKTILRTEAALIAFLAQVDLLRRWNRTGLD